MPDMNYVREKSRTRSTELNFFLALQLKLQFKFGSQSDQCWHWKLLKGLFCSNVQCLELSECYLSFSCNSLLSLNRCRPYLVDKECWSHLLHTEQTIRSQISEAKDKAMPWILIYLVKCFLTILPHEDHRKGYYICYLLVLWMHLGFIARTLVSADLQNKGAFMNGWVCCVASILTLLLLSK